MEMTRARYGGIVGLILTLVFGASMFAAERAKNSGEQTADRPAIAVWLDVDPSKLVVDDALAMIQAFNNPRLEVKGVSVLFGNGKLDQAMPIAEEVVNRFGPGGISPHPGAASADSLGEPTEAVQALANQLEQGPLTLIALGPLTNVATLIQTRPELVERIDKIVMVAGRRPGQTFTVDGGKTILPDANFEHDPEAMRVVLEADVPKVFAGWEVASNLWLTREDLDQLAEQSEAGQWINRVSQPWLDWNEKRMGKAAFNPFDSMAVAWVARQEVLRTYEAAARIESDAADEAREAGAADDARAKQNAQPAKDESAPKLVIEYSNASRQRIAYAYEPVERFKSMLLADLAGTASTRGAKASKQNVADERKQDVWLDVDTAVGVGDPDDGLMLIQAFHSPELNIRGISTVYGNTTLPQATAIAEKIVDRFGGENMPKPVPGASSPAALGEKTPAVEAMAEALRKEPMSIAAVGPVTNVGSLVMGYPKLAERIERIVMVAARRPGQHFGPDNPKTPGILMPDANFEHDVPAMQVLLDSDVPLVFTGYEVSSHVWLGRHDLERLRQTGGSGKWIAENTQYWLKRWEKGISEKGFNPFDTLAAGYLTHPQLIAKMPVTARITDGPNEQATPAQRADGATKSYLLAAPVDPTDQPHKTIIYAYKPAPAFHEILLERLAGNPSR